MGSFRKREPLACAYNNYSFYHNINRPLHLLGEGILNKTEMVYGVRFTSHAQRDTVLIYWKVLLAVLLCTSLLLYNAVFHMHAIEI